MRYQVTTPLTPREALEQALADFGPSGLGLQITSQTNLSIVFQGGGGHITVTAAPGAKTTLELETREWDYAVKQFMARVQQRRPGGSAGGAQAPRHPATSVVHGPRSLVDHHTSRSTREATVQRKIVGFHQDEAQDWVADLACGHQQHVRHAPPWVNRPWVVSPKGRRSRLGYTLDCKDCDQRVHESALLPG